LDKRCWEPEGMLDFVTCLWRAATLLAQIIAVSTMILILPKMTYGQHTKRLINTGTKPNSLPRSCTTNQTISYVLTKRSFITASQASRIRLIRGLWLGRSRFEPCTKEYELASTRTRSSDGLTVSSYIDILDRQTLGLRRKASLYPQVVIRLEVLDCIPTFMCDWVSMLVLPALL